MDTSIERRRDAARFLVASADHSQADALVRMGYQTVGPGKHATAWFPDAPEISSYFEHFSASIDQMIMQKTRAIAVPWQDALIELLGRVESTNLIGGSTGVPDWPSEGSRSSRAISIYTCPIRGSPGGFLAMSL